MVASSINTNLWWFLLCGVKRLKIMSTEMMIAIPILCCLLGEAACPETVTRLAGKCNGMIGMETNLLRCWNMSLGTFFYQFGKSWRIYVGFFEFKNCYFLLDLFSLLFQIL